MISSLLERILSRFSNSLLMLAVVKYFSPQFFGIFAFYSMLLGFMQAIFDNSIRMSLQDPQNDDVSIKIFRRTSIFNAFIVSLILFLTIHFKSDFGIDPIFHFLILCTPYVWPTSFKSYYLSTRLNIIPTYFRCQIFATICISSLTLLLIVFIEFSWLAGIPWILQEPLTVLFFKILTRGKFTKNVTEVSALNKLSWLRIFQNNLIGYMNSQTDRLVGGFVLSNLVYGRYSLVILLSRAFYESSGHALVNFVQARWNVRDRKKLDLDAERLLQILFKFPILCFLVNELFMIPLFTQLTDSRDYSLLIPLIGFSLPFVISTWIMKTYWLLTGDLDNFLRFSVEFLFVNMFCAIGLLHSPQLALCLFIVKDILQFFLNYKLIREVLFIKLSSSLVYQSLFCVPLLFINIEIFSKVWLSIFFLLIMVSYKSVYLGLLKK